MQYQNHSPNVFMNQTTRKPLFWRRQMRRFTLLVVLLRSQLSILKEKDRMIFTIFANVFCIQKFAFAKCQNDSMFINQNGCFVRIIKKWIEICCGHLYKYNAKTVAQIFSQIEPFANHGFFNFKSTNPHFWYLHRDQSIRFWMKNIEWKN